MGNEVILTILIIAAGIAIFAFAFKYLVDSLSARAKEKSVVKSGRSGPVTIVFADGHIEQDLTDCYNLTVVNLTSDDIEMTLDGNGFILKPEAKYVGMHASGHHDISARSLNTGRSNGTGFKFSREDTIYLDFEDGKLVIR